MKNKIYLLNNQNIKNTINLPVFRVDFIPIKINFQQYDSIIFTSKNAVYSIDSFNKDWKNKTSYAIAKQTAKLIEKLHGNTEYISDKFYSNDFAYDLIPLLKNQKVIFLRAEKIVSNLYEILKSNDINIEQKIIYRTSLLKIKKELKPKLNSIIIFSSPSCVDGFFMNFHWNRTYQAICIGKVTASYLPKEIKYSIPIEKSLVGCVQLAMKLCKT